MITLSEQSKKIIFIAFFVIFTIGTGYALYYFFFRQLATTPPATDQTQGFTNTFNPSGAREDVTPTTDTGTGLLPQTTITPVILDTTVQINPLAPVNVLRDELTQAISQGTDGSTRFYSPDDGRFYRINPDGTTTSLSDRQFFNVDKVDWSNIKDEAILEFPDGNNIYYNFETDRQATLPKHWEDFEFAPADSQIIAKSIGLDESNRFLVTADADGNQSTAIYSMGKNFNSVIPSWSPNNVVVGFSKTGTPQADGAEEIYLLGKNHEQLRSLIVPGSGFQPNWSPDGKKLLYSVYHSRDGYKPMLWVSDAFGQEVGRNRKKLNINTWADKCVWADKSIIYCGVPVSLPDGAGFRQESFNATSDDVYKINLSSGLSEKINTSEQNHPIRNPMLSQDGNQLIFTDAVTGKLYSYTLAK
ncbi:hypothetical protein KKG46_01990 [Patescibacteria group bacterium]|nr:hypothetical protein [Patescibacteria group bacterium]